MTSLKLLLTCLACVSLLSQKQFKNTPVIIFIRCILISHLIFVIVLSHSVVSDSVTPWIIAHQAPLSMGILQARILEWVAILSSRDLPNPGIVSASHVSYIAGWLFTIWTTREAQYLSLSAQISLHHQCLGSTCYLPMLVYIYW